MRVTLCDVGPRDGLQSGQAVLGPPMLHGEGVETGVDLDALIAVSEWLEGVLERELPGQVYRAGGFAPVAG